MRSYFLLAAIVIIGSLTAFGQKAKPDATTPVREAFDRLVDGIKQVDAEKVMAAYDKSDRLLIFNNNGTATLGWDNVKNGVDQSYPKIANVSLDITGLRVEMLGPKSAYVSCKWKQTQENDGKLESASGRMTLIYRQIGRVWKVVHRHTSPDNPGANRPLFDSERQPVSMR